LQQHYRAHHTNQSKKRGQLLKSKKEIQRRGEKESNVLFELQERQASGSGYVFALIILFFNSNKFIKIMHKKI
jgi:hypothetical protein